MENVCFTIGNGLIERHIYLEDSVPVRSVTKNKLTGMEWASDGKEPLITFQGIDLKGSKVTLEADTMLFSGSDFEVRWEFKTYEDIPVIESRIGVKGKKREKAVAESAVGGTGVEEDIMKPVYRDYADGTGCSSYLVTLTAITFYDRTDLTNKLVEEKEIPLHNTGICNCNGHVFILREDITGEECLLVKNAPGEETHFNKKHGDFYAQPITSIHICSHGIDSAELREDEYLYTYPVAMGVCSKGEGKQLFRQYYEKDYAKKATYIMSNTWGDRNCDKCVREEFILKEIDKAVQLGVDIVQIDDGWQQGITANSILAAGGCWASGYRQADPGFWNVNRSKFPDGFDNIVKAARERNISLGLWFSPDKYNDYEAWEQDADVMLDFYHKYGIRYFKIDGVIIENPVSEKNLLKMFGKVNDESEGNVVFNMDITAGKRFGYLFHREIGDLFVENRYTDWPNYYPHCTLRNLWELAQYFPVQRFQMEVLNNQRNKDKYHDILAPSEYDIDYLFASIMVANPLIWMEMTGLDEESSERLAGIISVYKKYREDFVEVMPILEKPSGFSLTGFMIKGKKQDYVLLFRELAEEAEFPFSVKEILATNDAQATKAPVRLSKKRSYLFGIIEDK